MKNQRIVLARRPHGPVVAEDFRLEEVELPAPAAGQLLIRNHYLSLDPYMRSRMDEAKSYAPPQPLGETMIGGTVGEVVESRNPKFSPGDRVLGMFGWQHYAVSDGSAVRKLERADVPLTVYLGAAGMPGITAWYGVNEILKPKPGETVIVSAASGAVGSVAGQLAKQRGARVVGIAGGPTKCGFVTAELRFDASVDYKSDFRAALKAATPDGIDANFENVGGVSFDSVLKRMNPFGRVALCGLIAGYEGESIPVTNVRSILVNRLSIRGFIISDHMQLWPKATAELVELLRAGKLVFRESIVDGLARAPEAFIGMLHGENFGKQLVKLC